MSENKAELTRNLVIHFTLVDTVKSFIADFEETGPDHPQTVNKTRANSEFRTIERVHCAGARSCVTAFSFAIALAGMSAFGIARFISLAFAAGMSAFGSILCSLGLGVCYASRVLVVGMVQLCCWLFGSSRHGPEVALLNIGCASAQRLAAHWPKDCLQIDFALEEM